MEILHAIKDRIVYGEVPVTWDKWKRILLERRLRGLDLSQAPATFYMGKGLMNVFDEMLPVKRGKIDGSKNTEAVHKALNGLEVTRAIVTDSKGVSFLVQNRDDGIPEVLENVSRVIRRIKPYEFGSMHTHTTDAFPSMTDVGGLFRPNNFLEIIVSPRRVIALLKTTDTPTFDNDSVATGYLAQMGRTKGKINGFDEFYTEFSAGISGKTFARDAWSLDYQDLRELSILGYEAGRGSKVFVLQNR